MASGAWYSQLFENTYEGGVLLALPYEALPDWDGTGDVYEEVVEEIDQFLWRPVGPTAGLFVTDEDGVQEAHWMRFDDRPELDLVAWSAWKDPGRPTLPEDTNKVARAWERRKDPRQGWLERRLRQNDLAWQGHDWTLSLASGILLLLHAEGRTARARLAKPHALARCGEVVPAGVAPGDYRVETLVINELPEGAQFCLVCRWVPVTRGG
jgi:hypothetical protein